MDAGSGLHVAWQIDPVDLLSPDQVPDPHGAVIAAGDRDRAAVERCAGHHFHGAGVAGEGVADVSGIVFALNCLAARAFKSNSTA